MNHQNSSCRLCLKSIQNNEKMALINDEFKEQFVNFTQVNLDLIEGLSKFVCEVCLRSVQLATALKLQFADNQRKLYSEIQEVQGARDDEFESLETEILKTSSSQEDPVRSKQKNSPAKERLQFFDPSSPQEDPVRPKRKKTHPQFFDTSSPQEDPVRPKRKKTQPQIPGPSSSVEVPVKSKPKKPPTKKRKLNPENISNISLDMQNATSMLIEPELNIMEPESDITDPELLDPNTIESELEEMDTSIKIKEEPLEEGEILFNNLYDRFNYTDPNTFNNSNCDEDDSSYMLEEMHVQNPKNTETFRKSNPSKNPASERKLPCAFCGKRYISKHMTRHINVEHKKIKFPCVVPDCTNAYSRKDKLRLHIQKAHINCTHEEYDDLLEKVRNLEPIFENESHMNINQPTIKYCCVVPDCQSYFPIRRTLKTHIKDKHRNLNPEELAEVMNKIEVLDPVYEMHDHQVVQSED